MAACRQHVGQVPERDDGDDSPLEAKEADN
jgi:hypothetical protein